MNYMQYPTQQQYGAQRQVPQYVSQPSWNNRIRPVSSVEEVRASSIDFDGSIFYFPDLANKKIYTKQINLDGTATLNIYNLQEQNPIEQVEFVTKAEFNEEMNKMQSLLNNLLIPKENEKVSLNNF